MLYSITKKSLPKELIVEEMIKKNKQAPPIPVDPLNEQVMYAKFRVTLKVLTQSMTNYGNHQVVMPTKLNRNAAAVRVWDFTRINSLEFYGLKVEEDL